MDTTAQGRVAVVGSGLAGSSLARACADAGLGVQVFDKARGPGGRLSTRRMSWDNGPMGPQQTCLDHSAPGFSARGGVFRQALALATEQGVLACWQPVMAPGGRGPGEAVPLQYLPVPDMPAWCRHLLQGIETCWSWPVRGLERRDDGWWLHGGPGGDGGGVGVGVGDIRGPFQRVVLAMPPAQAATLLAGHRQDWAQRAALVPMQACWTLMGVARQTGEPPTWDHARPETGPLMLLQNQGRQPGRQRPPGQCHWVAHARPGWSQRHLEADATWVQRELQAAVAEVLGTAPDWCHGVVHRWRYAVPHTAMPVPEGACWWDPYLGLGVCGDFLGGQGVEGAWTSGQALARKLVDQQVPA